jgi:phosphatidylserine decarboxylase
MEVGALLVGRIVNEQTAGAVRRGREKGHFAFGGSTVVLILEKNQVQLDRDILENSQRGEETLVKMGERIGTKCRRTMV